MNAIAVPPSVDKATEKPEHDSYDPAYFSRLFKIEDEHFWFAARNKSIAAIARRLERELQPGYRVLEVGCGTGNVLRVLKQVYTRGTVAGMDLFGEGLAFARARTSCALVQADVHSPPFDVPFDVIGLFDVLEHLPDDKQILRDISDLLSPGGFLILTVPAHMSLWSYFDEASHHCRRYEAAELKRKVLRAGFEIDYFTEYMASIFPVVWLGRRLATLAGRFRGKEQDADAMATSELRVVPVANTIFNWLLSLEASLISRRRQLPVGTSLMVVAHKRSIKILEARNQLTREP